MNRDTHKMPGSFCVEPRRKLRVLMVEDSADDAVLTLNALNAGGFDVDCLRVETEEAMQKGLAERNWDVVLSDYSLPVFSAEEALALFKERRLDIPFIIVSGCIGEEAAVALMKAGAHDFVMKGSALRLVPAVQRGLQEAQTLKQFNLAQSKLKKSEARFRAIASNLPGVVCQFLRLKDGSTRFSYVSEGSAALLGLHSKAVQNDPALFLNLILPQDRASYERSLAASAETLSTLDWEGCIRNGSDGDVKWINLRASPRRTSRAVVRWDGIMANITHTKLAEIEIKHSREQLAELSSHLQTVKEQERAKIAREIHDDLGGILTAVKIDLLWLHNRLPEKRSALQEKAGAIDALVDRAIEATRRIASDLRPGILEFGIIAAIEWQAREFENHTGIGCEIATANEDVPLDSDLSATLFRIFQEALTNIAKHANASSVNVYFGETEDGWLELEVRDNGRGITPEDRVKPKSFGIRGMQERARNLGGEIEISGAPGKGTLLSVRLPHPEAAAQPAEQQHSLF